MDKSQYEIISVTSRDIDRIFEPAEEKGHQSAYLAALFSFMYGFPVLENDDVNSVDGFPKAGEGLAEALMTRAAKFDEEHHPGVMAGGLMMNNGPSKAEWIGDEEMAVPPLRLETGENRDNPNEPHPTNRVSPGEARGILTPNPRRDNSGMEVGTWVRSRPDMTVKVRHILEDAGRQYSTIGMVAEAIKDPVFQDETRHAGPKTTLQLAEMLREDGALLYIPSYLDEEYADEQMA